MKYLNALNKIQGVGPKTLTKLMDFFDSEENIWEADFKTLLQSGVREGLVKKIIEEKKNIDPETEWEKLEKENIQVLLRTDSRYPRLLKEIPSAPYLLYFKTHLPDFNFNQATCISIVGSRKYTDYGRLVTEKISRELAEAGIIVVSGMALGIDAIAHKGALSGNGQTIAVLGNSLDDKNIYPRNHFHLSQEIMHSGALVSDYPLETPASNLTFPARNRIVAGLSLGTLVIEAGEKSGTLITSNMALEFNREVFSVPGSIFSPQSVGAHKLLQNGAKIVTRIEDILEEIGLEESKENLPKISRTPENLEEQRLLEILTHNPLHIDKLAKLSKLETMTVSSTLAMMEIKGWVKNIGGQNYIQL